MIYQRLFASFSALKKFDFRFSVGYRLFFLSLSYFSLLLFILFYDVRGLAHLLYLKNKPSSLVEAVIQPKLNYIYRLLFNANPLISPTEDPSVSNIQKKINKLLFSSLFKFGPFGYSTDLVKNYLFEDNYLLTVEIRDSVYWHDGSPLTTDDVIFTLNLIRSLKDATIFVNATNGGDIEVEKLDEVKMRIKLVDQSGNPKPNSSYISFLDFPVLPKHILQNYSHSAILNLNFTDFGSSPVGSGFFSYHKNIGSGVEFRRFDKFYLGQNNIPDKYIIRIFPSVEKIAYQFRLGNIDLFIQNTVFDPGESELMEVNGVGSKYFVSLSRKYAIFFNLRRKDTNFLNNSALLRRALSKAIDREFFGANTLTYRFDSPLPQQSYYYLNSDEYTYDPDDFQDRLKSLGFIKGADNYYHKDGKLLSFELTYFEDKFSKFIVNFIKESLDSIGVKVYLNPSSLVSKVDKDGSTIKNSFLDAIYNRNYDVLLVPVSNLVEADLYSEWHSTRSDYPGLNFSGFASKSADLFLEESRVKSGEEKRKALQGFFRIFNQEMPAIYLNYPGVKAFYLSKNKYGNIITKTDTKFLYDETNLYDIMFINQNSSNL